MKDSSSPGILHDIEWVVPLRNDFLTPIFEAFTALGYAPFYFFALPLLFWSWDRRAASRIAILVIASALVNYFLKDLFRDPRPDEWLRVAGHEPTSFGMPSGHTQLALVFWGGLAYEFGKRWAWIMATIFVVGIAFSRIYLGVHDLEDVIYGTALGILGMSMFWIFRQLSIQKFGHPLLIVAGFLLVFVFWPNEMKPADKVQGFFGMLVGWIVGRHFSLGWAPTDLTVRNRCFTAMIGTAIFAVLLTGVGFVMKISGLPGGVAFLLGGIIAGVLATYVVPLIFVKMRLWKHETALDKSSGSG